MLKSACAALRCLSSLNLIVIPWNKGQTCRWTSGGSERLSSLSRPGVQPGWDGASVILINFLFFYYFTWYTCSLKFNSSYQPDTMCEPGERCGKTCIKIIVGTSESIWNGLFPCFLELLVILNVRMLWSFERRSLFLENVCQKAYLG